MGGCVFQGLLRDQVFFLSQQIKETNRKENADQCEPPGRESFDCMGRTVCCLRCGSQLLLQSGGGQW